jgi:HEAT repeat protein
VTRPWPPFEDLLRDLDNPDRYARCRAAQGLGEGRDPRAFEPLVRALADPAGDVRARAAVALGKLRDPRAIAFLIAAMGDARVSVRSGATAAVKKFGKRAYAPLLAAYRGASGPLRHALIDALSRDKSAAVSELLIAALDDPDRALHLRVVGLLARRKDRRAVDRLLAALAEVRPGLERTLRAWRETEVTDAPPFERLQAEWAEILPRLDGYVRALGAIGDARAFAPLQELLELDESHVHAGIVPVVVTALRTIDNPRAVDLLHQWLDDPSRPGRQRLAQILAGIDLMNAVGSLRRTARVGDIGVLGQVLREAGMALEQFRSQQEGGRDTAAGDDEEIGPSGTELMRRLEGILRELGRGG